MSNYRTHLATLRRAVTATATKMPKPVADALADCDKIAEAVATMPAPHPHELGDAAAAAILDGRHPADDPTVVRLITIRALTGQVGGALESQAREAGERRVRSALTEHEDRLAGALRAAAQHAGEQLTRAHDVLGDIDLDDAEAVIRQGPDASRAWADAKEAQVQLHLLDAGAIALAGLVGSDHDIISAGRTLRLSVPSLEEYEQLGRQAEPWQIVKAGAGIDLAGRRDVSARRTQLNEQREGRRLARVDADQARVRAALGSTKSLI